MALSQHLQASGAGPLDLVVCGGTAMNVLGFVERVTKDVDVVALLSAQPDGTRALEMAKPLPPAVLAARDMVAKDLGLAADWLNDGPADLLRWGLPVGCLERLEVRAYGPGLSVHYLGRFDLICLKLYAYADTQTLRHREDILALAPSSDELEAAMRWVLTHDDSEAFLILLRGALTALGAPDVAARLG